MWNPYSWKDYNVEYQPQYSHYEELDKIKNLLLQSIPLVSIKEIENLNYLLSRVMNNEAFVLHCGDCAESFNTTSDDLDSYMVLLDRISKILNDSLGKQILNIGRIAGQFAKPRTNLTEIRNGVELSNYHGDMINSIKFDYKSRIHDPNNLIKAYNKSAIILNYIRAHFKKFELYTSHESLILDYEAALTRKVNSLYYNLSAHYLWIGNKTRDLHKAHLEYIRGISNPIAIKIDYLIDIDDLLKIIELVNPNNIAGKLTLISRMGVDKIDKFLPQLLRKLKREGKYVILSCDPMHGNTKLSFNGYKIRYMDDIKLETKRFIQITRDTGNVVGGIHLELTSKNVLECVNSDIELKKIEEKYCTLCDPRLNSEQSLELIQFLIKELVKG